MKAIASKICRAWESSSESLVGMKAALVDCTEIMFPHFVTEQMLRYWNNEEFTTETTQHHQLAQMLPNQKGQDICL